MKKKLIAYFIVFLDLIIETLIWFFESLDIVIALFTPWRINKKGGYSPIFGGIVSFLTKLEVKIRWRL